MVQVKGKAGTGKSSDLLKYMLKKSLNGTRGTFLTYNHLLVFEISKQISGFDYNLNEENFKQKATTTTYTIHSFIYNISKKLGVLLLMSNTRIEEIKTIMNNRLNLIQGYISVLLVLKDSYSKEQLITAFQNNNNFDIGTKMEAIDFIKSNNRIKLYDSKTDRNALINNHKKIKIKKLEEKINSDIFLSDYTNVL